MSKLITGADGQLGRALKEVYPNETYLGLEHLDISSHEELKKVDVSEVATIINAAGYTNVDEAETPHGFVEAWKANSWGVANLAGVARASEIALVHYSTDYVFKGDKDEPHTEDEPYSPVSIYGRSKAAGDMAATSVTKHYVLRTSWLIGDGKNFVRTMLNVGKDKKEVKVVADQYGRPTFTSELARATKYLVEKDAGYGVYNLSNDGDIVSWADLTKVIFEIAGYDCKVQEISFEEYAKGREHVAPRPRHSAFDLSKIKSAGFTPHDWRTTLEEYIKKDSAK